MEEKGKGEKWRERDAKECEGGEREVEGRKGRERKAKRREENAW